MWFLNLSEIWPGIVYILVLAWAWLAYLDFAPWNKTNFKKLALGVVAFRIAYALAQTLEQYSLWSKDLFSKTFITNPGPGILDFKGGYFIFYSWSRFWFAAVMGILVAWVFYKFLELLKKRQERFFLEGEVELGFLAALLVGWPNFVVFLPLALFSTLIISIARWIIWKKIFTTLGLPMLFSAALVLVFEPYFWAFLHLSALTL